VADGDPRWRVVNSGRDGHHGWSIGVAGWGCCRHPRRHVCLRGHVVVVLQQLHVVVCICILLDVEGGGELLRLPEGGIGSLRVTAGC
jgi:hypothetical protein